MRLLQWQVKLVPRAGRREEERVQEEVVIDELRRDMSWTNTTGIEGDEVTNLFDACKYMHWEYGRVLVHK